MFGIEYEEREGGLEMEVKRSRYFTDDDTPQTRVASHQFYKNEKTGEIRIFDDKGKEVPLEEIKELIEGLKLSYLDISEEEYVERTLAQIKYDLDNFFDEYVGDPPEKKFFRKDLKRNWSFKCENCLEKVSSKTCKEYWSSSNWHINGLYGKSFCSEWCANKYREEVKRDILKKRKLEQGL